MNPNHFGWDWPVFNWIAFSWTTLEYTLGPPSNQGNLTGESAVAAILLSHMEGELWILSLLSPPSNFVPFSHGLKLHTHTFWLLCSKHAATKFDRTNSGGTITRSPCMIIKMAATPTVLHYGQRETQFPLLNSLGPTTYIKGSTESSAPLNNAEHFNLLITWCTGGSKKRSTFSYSR